MKSFPPKARQGSALAVTLIFVALLTGLVVAFFSRATLNRSVSNTSFQQTATEIFALGALDTIIGDLKQEILLGSSTTGSPFHYYPNTPWNAVPSRTGITGLPPNLVKFSAAEMPFCSGTGFKVSGTIRASGLESTGTAWNGRWIGLDRWNKALLLPKADPVGSDLTPARSGILSLNGTSMNWRFEAPDWVLVARNGNNPVVNSGTQTLPADMKWSGTAGTAVVGRYAYCVYNEGGLLDMNVAGYPFDAGGGALVSGTDIGRKGSLHMADLTQLPVSPDQNLTPAQVAAIVTWRNQYTMRSGAVSPSLLGTANAYVKAITSNTNGFLRVSGSQGESDNAFVTRQALIRFLLSGTVPGLSVPQAQNLLQYVGTFSRGIEQPSVHPNPLRPRIVSNAPDLPITGSAYRGGNDEGIGSDDRINPVFLNIRVEAEFTRANGRRALVGEALVQTRFPLGRIEKLQTGSAAEIQTMFGFQLRQSTSNGLRNGWTYTGSPSSGGILTLEEVAAVRPAREPNFIELLKAAISAGSLGKAAPTGAKAGNYAYKMDKSVDYQVMQIAANILDQWDEDGFPTLIDFSVKTDSGAAARQVRGAENLPYLYRVRGAGVTAALPQIGGAPVVIRDSDSQVKVQYTAKARPVGAAPTLTGSSPVGRSLLRPRGSLQSTGTSAFFLIPEVWNPCDATMAISGTLRPAKFRAVALTQDPQATEPNWQIQALGQVKTLVTGVDSSKYTVTYSNPGIDDPLVKGSAAFWTENNTALEFTDANSFLFHEPTLLWRPGIPSGSNLVAGASNRDGTPLRYAMNPNLEVIGWCVGTVPLAVSLSMENNMEAIVATYSFSNGFKDVVGYTNRNSLTFRLQYQDGSNWITYDEKYANFDTMMANEPSGHPNASKPNLNGMAATGNPLGVVDPRCNRFSMPWRNGGNPSYPQILDVDGGGLFSVTETQRPGTGLGGCYWNYVPGAALPDATVLGWYPQFGFTADLNNGGPKLLRTNYWPGLLAQNNPAVLVPVGASPNPSGQWGPMVYEDPDGVVRRAMGAYVAPDSTNAPAKELDGLPMVTANTFAANGTGVSSPTAQNQSRPIILNRPFRGVSELSYAFRGTPWKNIDFFTPESGDSALLDVFCVNEMPADGIVAGKVDLNTRQPAVLKAILANGYRNETGKTGAGYCAPTLAQTEVDTIASRLVERSLDPAFWRGPLANVGEIVGRYIGNNVSLPSNASDTYTYTVPPMSGGPRKEQSWTYSGFSAALGNTGMNGEASQPIWNSDNRSSASIQRFREAAIRPLVNSGQVRVWNLLIDLVAQTGRYPVSATNPNQFQVEGEKRYWLHVSIDRATGAVIDKQIETITE